MAEMKKFILPKDYKELDCDEDKPTSPEIERMNKRSKIDVDQIYSSPLKETNINQTQENVNEILTTDQSSDRSCIQLSQSVLSKRQKKRLKVKRKKLNKSKASKPQCCKSQVSLK